MTAQRKSLHSRIIRDYERAVSYFSNQLRVLVEKLDISRAQLADLAEIPASTLHKYFHGLGRGPDTADLEKLCAILEDKEDRAQLVIAHLRDETPHSAADLVQLASLVHNGRVREDSPAPAISLPKSVREDFEFLQGMAAKHPEVVDSIRSTVRIIRGR